MSPRRNRDPPLPLPPASVSFPPEPKGGGAHSPAGEGVGSPNSSDWRKSLPLCLLCLWLKGIDSVESMLGTLQV